MVLQPLGKEERYDDLGPERIELYSPQYFDLPEGVRANLTGRMNNLIGFIRKKAISSNDDLIKESNDEIDIGNLLFESACQKAIDKNISGCAKMILRAVRHGFTDLQLFEEKLTEWEKSRIIEPYFKELLIRQDSFIKAKNIASSSGLDEASFG